MKFLIVNSTMLLAQPRVLGPFIDQEALERCVVMTKWRDLETLSFVMIEGVPIGDNGKSLVGPANQAPPAA